MQGWQWMIVSGTNSSLTTASACGLANTCCTLATGWRAGSILKMGNTFLEVIPIEELEAIVGS